MSLKIVHTADFHIGVSLSHLGTTLAKIRGDELRHSLVRVCDFCKEKNVDALLISGDLFDLNKPTKADCEFVKNTLSSLSPIDVFIICGNHDYMSLQSPFSKENYFSSNVHIFPCFESSFDFADKNAVFWGKSYSTNTTEPAFEECVFDKNKINIMLLHGDVEKNSSFNTISKETLSRLSPNYAAFGHIHAGGVFETENVRCAYSGAVEGHSFGDCNSTGIIYAEISENQTTITPVDFSVRKYKNIDMNITGKNENEILHEAASLLNQTDFFRINFIGECVEGAFPDINYIKKELSQKAFYIDITDSLTLAYDFEKIFAEESLRGAFLRELRENAHSEEEFIRAAKIGLDALGGRVPDLRGEI